MSINVYVELFALLMAIILYKDLAKQSVLLYFIPFLAITASVELYASSKDRALKIIIYNYFTAFEFLFYAFLFYHNLQLKKLKKIVLLFFPFYILCFAINQLFVQGFYQYHRYTSLLGAFFIVVFICMFFYETILPETLHVKLFSKPFFWVTVGLLFFYLGSVIIFAMFEYLSSNHLQNQGVKIYQAIINSLNVILYGSFSIAFILCRKNRKIS